MRTSEVQCLLNPDPRRTRVGWNRRFSLFPSAQPSNRRNSGGLRRKRLPFPFSVWAPVALIVILGGSGKPATGDLVRVEKADEAMGATFSMVLLGADKAELEAAATAAIDEVHRLDQMLSNYRTASEWSEVNRSAALHPVKVSSELFQLLSECIEYSRESGGAFDITVGPLMKVWGFYKGEGVLPRKTVVASALSRVGYRHVRLDRDFQPCSSIRLT